MKDTVTIERDKGGERKWYLNAWSKYIYDLFQYFFTHLDEKCHIDRFHSTSTWTCSFIEPRQASSIIANLSQSFKGSATGQVAPCNSMTLTDASLRPSMTKDWFQHHQASLLLFGTHTILKFQRHGSLFSCLVQSFRHQRSI